MEVGNTKVNQSHANWQGSPSVFELFHWIGYHHLDTFFGTMEPGFGETNESKWVFKTSLLPACFKKKKAKLVQAVLVIKLLDGCAANFQIYSKHLVWINK